MKNMLMHIKNLEMQQALLEQQLHMEREKSACEQKHSELLSQKTH